MVDTFTVQPKRGDAYKTNDFTKAVGNLFNNGIIVGVGNLLAIIDQGAPALNIKIDTGAAFIGGIYVELTVLSDAKTMTDNATNHIYLQLTVSVSDRVTGAQFTINTTGVDPTDPFVKLGTVVTSAGDISSVKEEDNRATPIQGSPDIVSDRSTGLSAGETLAINEAIMVDGNLSIKRLTSAKATQCIGVMKRAKASGEPIGSGDIALYGVVTMIAGGTVVAGDKLTSDTATAGRVITKNTTVTSHDHTAFTLGAPVVGSGSQYGPVTDGGGTLMRNANIEYGLFKGVSNIGTTNLTAKTDSSNVTVTHGAIIGKALEGATVGNTFKALLCLTG